MIVQFGGQTPLKRARRSEANGVPIIGTSPDMIDAPRTASASRNCCRARSAQPPNRTARTRPAASPRAEIGYPLVVRPSYVLGGRAMEIVHEQKDLEALHARGGQGLNESPVLLDRFLNDAIEVDVDAHVRRQDGDDRRHHGAHRAGRRAFGRLGCSAAAVPSLSARLQDDCAARPMAMARALKVVGLMNVQFAIQGNAVVVLEVNPRASRTVPFVSKAHRLPLAKIAALHGGSDAWPSRASPRESFPPTTRSRRRCSRS